MEALVFLYKYAKVSKKKKGRNGKVSAFHYARVLKPRHCRLGYTSTRQCLLDVHHFWILPYSIWMMFKCNSLLVFHSYIYRAVFVSFRWLELASLSDSAIWVKTAALQSHLMTPQLSLAGLVKCHCLMSRCTMQTQAKAIQHSAENVAFL